MEICPRGNNKVLFISIFMFKCLYFYAIIAMDLECEIQRKTHLHVWKINNKLSP